MGRLTPIFPSSLFARMALILLTGLLATGGFPGWAAVLAPAVTAALWPLGSWLLLAPQHGAHDLDANRPL